MIFTPTVTSENEFKTPLSRFTGVGSLYHSGENKSCL
jgi:hypothetical protein